MENHWVQFKISDIHFPEPQEVLHELHAGEELSGVVMDISAGAVEEDSFAAIQVAGLVKPVLVPLKKIQPMVRTNINRRKGSNL